MKTITIPKSFGFPTVDIVINGMRYTLQSGVEITTEDALAEVIENAIVLLPKTNQAVGVVATATKEWQKLIDVELTEAVTSVTKDLDVNGKAFEVSEVLFRVYMPAVTDGGTAYFRVGQGTKGFQYSISQGTLLYLGGHCLIADGALHHIIGHMSTTTEYAYRLTTPYGGYSEGIALGVDKLTSVTVGLSNATLKMPVGTKIKVFGR